MKRSHILTLALVGFSLSGCGPTVLGLAAGAGASVGIAASREGGVRSAATDVRIRAEINDKWFKYNLDTFRKLNLTVDQGRVLITGIVQNPDARVEAVRLAWQVEGVRQVINEVRVADSQSIASYADDLWITTRLRTAMTFDRDVQSINYSIDTVDGTVYLMGISQSEKELKRATELAREIPHVKQVVSYVKRVGEPLPGANVSPQPAQAQRAPSSMPPALAAAPSENLLSQPASPRALEPSDGEQYSLQPQPVQRQKLN